MPDEGSLHEGSLRGRRILVVEDEFFIADEIARALKAAGAEVAGPVPSVEQALAALAAPGALDAVLLDVNLDGTIAWPVAEALLARGVPFVLATGYDSGVIPAAYAHLPRHEKPVAAGDLVRAVAERLGPVGEGGSLGGRLRQAGEFATE